MPARANGGSKLAILDEATRETPYGWVFFYQSARYLQTREVSDALAGNAPVLVTKGGAVHVLGTAEPTDAYLARFEKTGTPHVRPIRRLHEREMPGDR